jgi:lysophospholipase L1-like esterase
MPVLSRLVSMAPASRRLAASVLLCLPALGAFAQAPNSGASPATPTEPRSALSAVTAIAKDKWRHEQFRVRIRQGPVDLVFLGDSITDSWNRQGEAQWLRFAPLNPANLGISGDRTEHVLWRLQNGTVDGLSPRLVVLLIGTNNLKASLDERPEWCAEGVRAILEELRVRLPGARILLHAILPRDGPGDVTRARVEAVNRLLHRFADGRTIHFFDAASVFKFPDGRIRKDLMPDALHPNPLGYAAWYEVLRPEIDRLLALPAPPPPTSPPSR